MYWAHFRERRGIQIKFIDQIGKFPPVIARKAVRHWFGGTVSPKTLANADSLGCGPDNRFYIGRSVAYETESLLRWLDSRKK